MCGRFVLARQASELVALFDVDLSAPEMPEPSWNVPPTRQIAVIIDAVNKSPSDELPMPVVRRLESARWGLVPGFATSPSEGAPLFNARVESAAEKPAFMSAVTKRRAAIPASGYFELMTRPDGTKAAQFIHAPDDEPLLFAGLYEWWRDPRAADDDPTRWLLSATILTRSATGPLAALHDRMPVFLEPGLMEDWLDPHRTGGRELLEDLSEAASELAAELEFHTVSSLVGSVVNDGPDLVAPIE